MNGYYFIFALGLFFLAIATFFDLKKKREIPNWVPFSLIGIAIAYRAFYAIYSNNIWFLVFGIIGFVIFYIVGSVFYYARALGGADVKLLAAVGVILPYSSYHDMFLIPLSYVFILFFIGSIYSLLYSVAIAIRNRIKFRIEMGRLAFEHKKVLIFTSILGVLIFIFVFIFTKLIVFSICLGALLILFPLLYVYLKAVDSCMLVQINSQDLTEGDWIDEDIKVGNKFVRKSVHGLSLDDIVLLQKAKKKIYVHQGIPFVPAILISLIFMVFFYLTWGQYLSYLIPF